MAFRRMRSVGGTPIVFHNAEDFTPGMKIIAGVFKGRVTRKKAKTGEDFENLVFDSAGVRHEVFETGQLKYKFQDIELGTYCEITYVGIDKLEGGRRAHNFDVQVAEEEVPDADLL